MNQIISPAVNPEQDLAYKPDYQANSYFAIGHSVVNGHTVNYLFHIMGMLSPQGAVVNANFSVTDETSGEYFSEDHVFPVAQCEISSPDGNGFKLVTPIGYMEGDVNEIRLFAKMENAAVDCTIKKNGGIIYNGGTGSFSTFLGKNVQQFSMPIMDTSGTLIIAGTEYTLNGRSWFDRQWQFSVEELKEMQIHSEWNWSWMDINLSNGEIISLWDMHDILHDTTKTWGTILHEDGSQEVVDIVPLAKGAAEVWSSPVTGQRYPTRWTVRIPSKDAVLNVSTDIKEQEIVSTLPSLNKYEGACKVNGTYSGRNVTGYTYVELLGKWQ